MLAFGRRDLLLFDLDGTLSDPLVGIARSINYALSHFGYPERDPSESAAYVGPPLDRTFRSLTGVQSVEQVAALVDKYRERYGEVGYSENVLYRGIATALQDLHDAGVPLAVCTSKRSDFAEKILRAFGIRQHFWFVSGGDIGIEKPQQIEALCKQGLAGTSTLMVGDRAIDIVAAHANGLQSAGALWGYGERAELEAENPHYLLSSPAELRTLAFAGRRDCR